MLDLPSIDRILTERGVDVRWTVVGSGPDEQRLRDVWTSSRVSFLGTKKHEEVIEGLLATCLQHEMDHLEGVLFIDHLSRLKREMILKKLAKQRKERALQAA